MLFNDLPLPFGTVRLVGYSPYERMAVSPENLLSMSVDVPSVPEQKKISDFFDLIDKQIQVEKDKLETIKLVKKGLLQQMFV